MTLRKARRRIAIIGGGPSGLFMYKKLVRSKTRYDIDIFEKTETLGAGMPYSKQGANREHITNVSGNEIPELVTTIQEWMKTVPESRLSQFSIDPTKFNKYHVLPRLLFGEYLSDQFQLLKAEADKKGIKTNVHYNSQVSDITDYPTQQTVLIETQGSEPKEFDAVVISTGHKWPARHEGKIEGYFDSPYPPSKLELKLNHTVAIKGASLTAIDAIRTLARQNGRFYCDEQNKLVYEGDKQSSRFKIMMHSRNGLLPAIRFHLEEPQVTGKSLLTEEEVIKKRKENNGFLPLDYVFEKNFKEGFRDGHPEIYRKIKNLTMEEFVKMAMDMREGKPPFELFREEYNEALKSIEQRESIYWKEMLAELSFLLNYPAKYFSAEDMLRLETVLKPLIATVIAFVPQSSCDELFALHEAGKLDIISVGHDGETIPQKSGGIIYKYTGEDGKTYRKTFRTFVDCSGQKAFPFEEFPFKGLLMKKSVSEAHQRFQSQEVAFKMLEEGDKRIVRNAVGDYFLKVPGVAINDCFQIVNEYGAPNERVYIMAVPYIGGHNPDYSGLDFCEQASEFIAEKIAETSL
ncbi:FAD/NAD(P)-binding protein [Dyadobacter sp. Leaf189]|uniref:FAD/NAD(P)-binding protein n=1 Tax=Dyadobacter sp. Leaf189 TaxID=1736295 RepID=UPI0006FBD010|nr:FAD/NAD(P)-binding protein [Dyadobacter sp. Leaf189]KQS34041.1 hypothetical protein ASG33_08450 [Dyadobacter sp. Leaf189]